MPNLSIMSVLSSASMLLLTSLRGSFVGKDLNGNRYYRGKPVGTNRYERRWVMYPGAPEASSVPPEWHGWLHHQMKDPPQPDNALRQTWQRPPLANMTGTELAYRPPGHTLETGYRDRATGDYESWSPPE